MADIDGLKELQRKLEKLPQKAEAKVIRQSLRKGSKIIKQKARTNAGTMIGGTLGKLTAKWLVVRAGKRKKGVISIMTGFRKGYESSGLLVFNKGDGERHFLPSVTEFGFKHFGGKTIAGKGWYRSAFDSTASKARTLIMKEMWEGISAQAKNK